MTLAGTLNVSPLSSFAPTNPTGTNVYTLFSSNGGTITNSMTVNLSAMPLSGTYLSYTTGLNTAGTQFNLTATRIANSFNWTGAGTSGGLWTDPANWNVGYVDPISIDTAVFDTSTNPSATVTGSQGAAVLQLNNNGTLSLSGGGSLAVGNITGGGAMSISNAGLSVSGTASNAGGLSVNSGGTLSGSGTVSSLVSLTGGGTLAGSLTYTDGIVATGGTINGAAAVNSTLTVNAGTLSVNTAVSPTLTTVTTGGVLQGSGSINGPVTLLGGTLAGASYGSTVTVGASGGTISGGSYSGYLTVNGALNLGATITTSGATINTGGTLFGQGAGEIDAPVTLNGGTLDGNLVIDSNIAVVGSVGGTINSTGTVNFGPIDNGILTQTGGTLTVNGSLLNSNSMGMPYDLSGGTLTGTGAISYQAPTSADELYIHDGELVTGSLAITTNYLNLYKATMNLNGGAVNIAGGQLNIGLAGNFYTTGAATYTGSSTINLSNSQLKVYRDAVLSGADDQLRRGQLRGDRRHAGPRRLRDQRQPADRSDGGPGLQPGPPQRHGRGRRQPFAGRHAQCRLPAQLRPRHRHLHPLQHHRHADR